jgi:hypothetical protein
VILGATVPQRFAGLREGPRGAIALARDPYASVRKRNAT